MMIKFSKSYLAESSPKPSSPQQLPLWDDSAYHIPAGEECLVIAQKPGYVEFLSGNEVLWVSTDQEGRAYDFIQEN